MELSLHGRVGEHRITRQQLASISEERLELFQQELANIAERDGLAVEITEQMGRGYLVRWWPANEVSPW